MHSKYNELIQPLLQPYVDSVADVLSNRPANILPEFQGRPRELREIQGASLIPEIDCRRGL